MLSYQELRKHAKTTPWEEMEPTDQSKKIPQPPYTTPVPEDALRIQLPDPESCKRKDNTTFSTIKSRHSHRKYNDEIMSIEELSFLLFCADGYKGMRTFSTPGTFRTAPSAGCRHPIETFIAVLKVEGIQPGIYRYLPITNELALVREGDEDLPKTMINIARNQQFAGRGSVVFIWAADMYRCEWRYTNHAHKLVLLDVGHICQNLYLACEEIGCGTCAIAAYNQADCDSFLGIDGESFFTIYMAPVGKINDLDETNKPYLR